MRLARTLIRDVVFGFRGLRKNPAFATITIVTLALGIGINAAIFSVANGVLLRSLPYAQPTGLYVVREDVQVGKQIYAGTLDNGGNFEMWKTYCKSFSSIAAMEPVNDNLDFVDRAMQVHGARASADLFPMLGIQPEFGRDFSPEEDQAGRDREVILTHAFWKSWFNSNPEIVGKTVRLNGYDYTVVGVLPPTFYFPNFDQIDGGAIAGWTSTIQYFVPLGLKPSEANPAVGHNMNFTVIVRIRPGLTRQQALSDLDTVEREISLKDPHAQGATLRANLVPLKTAIVGDTEQTIWMLTAAAALVLVIVCMNLAGLLLARSMNRIREMAVRRALGATRWRLLRQLGTEGILLACIGGALGLLVALAAIRLIIDVAPMNIPRVESIRIDFAVLIFTVVITLGAGVVFSIVPWSRLGRTEPMDALKSASATISGVKSAAQVRNLLATGEVALCTVLLISALLLAESLIGVIKQNRWLEAQRVLAVDLIAPPHKYESQVSRRELYAALLAKISALPGTRFVGFASALPLQGESWTEDFDFQEAPEPAQRQISANVRFVSPGYFEAIGLPVLRGTSFNPRDEGQYDVVLSQSFATRSLSGENPIGMHLRCGDLPYTDKNQLCRVIGVVADARTEADQQPPPTVYFPNWIFSPTEVHVIIRTAANAEATVGSVDKLLRGLDSEIAIPREQTMQAILDEAVAPRRFVTGLGILFAGFAILLAALGLYGLVSISVAQRTHEIGIRLALGAQPIDVMRLVLGWGMRVTIFGVALGVGVALALTRLISALLFGIGPSDPRTFSVGAILVILVALCSCFIPAHRAMRVDPIIALHYE